MRYRHPGQRRTGSRLVGINLRQPAFLWSRDRICLSCLSKISLESFKNLPPLHPAARKREIPPYRCWYRFLPGPAEALWTAVLPPVHKAVPQSMAAAAARQTATGVYQQGRLDIAAAAGIHQKFQTAVCRYSTLINSGVSDPSERFLFLFPW